GAVAADALGRLWLVWWSGDALGDVLVAPLLLTWVRAARAAGRRLEAAGLLAALLLLTGLLLRNPLSYVYAVFPVLVWAALRFGSRGTAMATAVVATLTIWYTLHGLGPFVASAPTENLALLQTFLGLTAVTGLVLAAVVTERGAAEGALGREVAFVELLQTVAVAANEAPTADHALRAAMPAAGRTPGAPARRRRRGGRTRVLLPRCHRARPGAARRAVPHRHAAGPRHRTRARRGGAARARSAPRGDVRPVGRRHRRGRSQRPLHPQQPGVPGDDRLRRRGARVPVARRHHLRGRPARASRADGGAGARHAIVLHVR